MKIVRLRNNAVAEILPEATYERGIAYWYGAEFAAQCVEAPDDVQERMIYDPDTQTFSDPPDPPTPEPDYTAFLSGLMEGYASE